MYKTLKNHCFYLNSKLPKFSRCQETGRTLVVSKFVFKLKVLWFGDKTHKSGYN